MLDVHENTGSLQSQISVIETAENAVHTWRRIACIVMSDDDAPTQDIYAPFPIIYHEICQLMKLWKSLSWLFFIPGS